ncbi:hypothetical protein [Streptomyces botrytidirepellens]|uniref:Uncharacterized protein n=1 Tax=Streptomyces botrytidirepellens TaxID=2486417 RepID=A0A3M8US88_9ACTN|nr:hypothetical protein [Streptomyces botrytidirepellens]RNG08210.1 hypothetical protein EEJ42_33455 [Streptomyces botrytidirepellens]
MDPKTRAAVQSYYRLTETLQAAIQDPDRYEPGLTAAAYEANRLMAAAGLLSKSPQEITALVREIYPDWNPS